MARTVSAKLTDSAIRGVATTTPTERRDHVVPTLFIRINPLKESGYSYTWKVDERTDSGKRKPVTLGKYPVMSITEARKAARARAGDVATGEAEVLVKDEDPTLGKLIDDYERLNPKRLKGVVRIAATLRRDFPVNLKVRAITRATVQEWHHKLAAKKSPATSNRSIAYLSGLLGYAVSRDILAVNPARISRNGDGIVKFNDRPERARFFTEKEWASFDAALDTHAPSWLADLCRVAVGCGGRQGELLAMHWHDVRFDDGMLHFKDPKNGKPHDTPMTAAAWGVLKDRAAANGTEGPVFADANANMVPKLFDRVLEAAGIAKHDSRGVALSFKSLRTTFASWLVQKTHDLHLVSQLLNHSGLDVTAQHYAHLLPKDTAERMRAALG